MKHLLVRSFGSSKRQETHMNFVLSLPSSVFRGTPGYSKILLFEKDSCCVLNDLEYPGVAEDQ